MGDSCIVGVDDDVLLGSKPVFPSKECPVDGIVFLLVDRPFDL
jgi:hypothetical protein